MEEPSQEQAALEFLGELELRESRLLSWGIVDGAFSEEELEELAEAFVIDKCPSGLFEDSDELLDWLEERVLVLQLPDQGGYRTRMAETVRLASSLRQIFQGDRWRNAPSLVGDYRFAIRPREYPERNVFPEQVLDQVFKVVSRRNATERVIRALLHADSKNPVKLAKFQVDATIRLLGALEQPARSGTIVCAGTGSGKTLAFYLPAFAWLARSPTTTARTRCLALYPRNELLKDQFQTAVANALMLRPEFESLGLSPPSVGAFFGSVPYNPKNLLKNRGPRGWLSEWTDVQINDQSALRCPFLQCTVPSCKGTMAWLRSDIEAGHERLLCTACSNSVGPETVRLTRDSMCKAPPHILFTTTEMLNRNLSNRKYGRLWGVGKNVEAPELVLLDEVHTYSGVHGAHVALALRRFRWMAKAYKSHYVGLSATLADAERFMAELVDLFPSTVAEISPRPEDLEQVGMEYLLALRGDPVSGANLLSTSIQASMLMRRAQDVARTSSVSEGAYGSKVFVFTDNLDVTNRLYHDLLDAEGWSSPGRPNHREQGSLANMRGRAGNNAEERMQAGQRWDLVDKIGHSLADGTRGTVGRTSSQDAGVEGGVHIIVATASLEVGFDDPDVGVVIQHKAPQTAAAYLQRKGRAGRNRGMRPWTVVVLSEYGRDRLAYQGYEGLISPTVPPRYLPIQNRYVLRMQAGFALMDWLSKRSDRAMWPDVWKDLSRPADGHNPWKQETLSRQALYAEAIRGVLSHDSKLLAFTKFISKDLNISEEEVQALLWEPPRPLVLEVLPTVLRRLERQWSCAGRQDGEYHTNNPMPEFVPSSLFSTLELPEVCLVLEEGSQYEREEWMPLVQALGEFAPGRVSKRFSIEHTLDAHWVPISWENENTAVSRPLLGNEEDLQFLGNYRYAEQGVTRELPVYRPFRMRLERVPIAVQPSSKAILSWHTQLVAASDGLVVELPINSAWRSLIREVRFFTHNLGDSIEVRRFATQSDWSLLLKEGSQLERFDGTCSFVDEDVENGRHPFALGFSATSDALAFRVELPDDILERCKAAKGLLPGLRTAWFRHCLETSDALQACTNTFQRRWLADLCIAAVVSEALSSGDSLEATIEAITNRRANLSYRAVLGLLLQAGEDEENKGRTHEELAVLLEDGDMTNTLDGLLLALRSDPDEDWLSWVRSRALATLGQVLMGACQRLCPELDAGDLVLDLDSGPKEERSEFEEIWLVESVVGGAGFVEEILVRYGEDPRRFIEYVESELAPSDFEEADDDLTAVLRWLEPEGCHHDAQVEAAVRNYRISDSNQQREQRFMALRQVLIAKGRTLGQTSTTALGARLLRPGSSGETDALLLQLVRGRASLESRLGFEIDGNAMAVALCTRENLDEALTHVGTLPHCSARPAWRLGVLAGLTWPRGWVIRANQQNGKNLFAELPQPDRLLLTAIQPNRAPEITLQDGWEDGLRQALLQGGRAVLVARDDQGTELRQALLHLQVVPLDTKLLLAYPRVRGVVRESARVRVSLDLPEALQ